VIWLLLIFSYFIQTLYNNVIQPIDDLIIDLFHLYFLVILDQFNSINKINNYKLIQPVH